MISLASIPLRIIGSLNFDVRAAIALGALTIAPTPALADMHVRGSPEAVRIEAKNSSVEEILAALSRAFDMRYRSYASLDKPRSGTYAGPLPLVVMRVLEGYNFVLKTDNGHIVVTVVGTNAADTLPGSSGAVQRPAEAALTAQPPGAVKDAARQPAAASTAFARD